MAKCENYETVSQPTIKGTIPNNVLTFHHSFGYNSKKCNNLCAADENTIIYSCGNVLHFLDVKGKELRYQRSHDGLGIGHIVKNNKFPHIAVAENGSKPKIIIYNWPSMKILQILGGGTHKIFNCVRYSPDGHLLCSIGDYPESLMTLWNWKDAKILKQKSLYGNTVTHIEFSLYSRGHLTTGGSGYIEFWKIGETFTGSKLMGQMGKFGMRNIPNISGISFLPDGQVLTGSNYGNLLLWNNGVIRLEVCGLNGKSCHSSYISQIFLDGKEIVTIGRDGIINTWYLDTIDKADPTDENYKLEMRPYYCYQIGCDTHLSDILLIVKQNPENPCCSMWFAQDYNGKIWIIDLNHVEPISPEILVFSHCGAVMDICASPYGHNIATIGNDGKIIIYNYQWRSVVWWKQFTVQGRSLLWLPKEVDSSGSLLAAGFSDGVLRVFAVCLKELEDKNNHFSEEAKINLIYVAKLHSDFINKILVNSQFTLLVTGSEDESIFVHQISQNNKQFCLVPIGLIEVNSKITSIGWKIGEACTIMVGHFGCRYSEFILPEQPVPYTTSSLLLKDIPKKEICLKSVKPLINMEVIKNREFVDSGQDCAECTRPDDGCSDGVNPVIFAFYITPNTLWFSLGGFEYGYIYECQFGNDDSLTFSLKGQFDSEISSYILSDDSKYLILGMQNGSIVVVLVEDPCDKFSNYWQISMHDNYDGAVKSLCFSNDKKLLFSCGTDGSIFSYYLNNEEKLLVIDNSKECHKKICASPQVFVPNINDTTLTLEQQLKDNVLKNSLVIAKHRQSNVLNILKKYAVELENIMKRNDLLPESQKFAPEEFIIDKRIIESENSNLKLKLSSVEQNFCLNLQRSRILLKKLNHHFLNAIEVLPTKIHAENHDWNVSSFRQQYLTQCFKDTVDIVTQKLKNAEVKDEWEDNIRISLRAQERRLTQDMSAEIAEKAHSAEAFEKGIYTNLPEYKYTSKLNFLIEKYQARKQKIEKRQKEWDDHLKKKQEINTDHPDDIAGIEEAKLSIGDFKLKTSPNYQVPKHLYVSSIIKYNEILKAREKVTDIKAEFNKSLFNLRNKKMLLVDKIVQLQNILHSIHSKIPKEEIRIPAKVPAIDFENEFPEKQFEPECISNLIKCGTNLFVNDTIEIINKFSTINYNYIENDNNEEIHEIGLKMYSGHEKLSKLLHDSDFSKDTIWEKEYEKIFNKRNLFMQDVIVRKIQKKIDEFDEAVKQLHDFKIDTDVNITLQELHILALNQELIILKEFDNQDTQLKANVLNILSERHSLQIKILDLQNNLEEETDIINNLIEKEKNIIKTFHDTLSETENSRLLKNIFKRKAQDSFLEESEDTDEQLSLSDDSSTDVDESNLNNTCEKIGKVDSTMKYTKEQYDMTLALRSERNLILRSLEQQKKKIDLLKKEIDNKTKKMKNVDNILMEAEKELEVFQLEKQKRLNEVECVAILHLDQLQYFSSRDSLVPRLSGKLLFSENTLKQLHHRVDELQHETKIQEAKHKQNKLHFAHMKSDCSAMEVTRNRLKSKIIDTMLKKFGREIDLDELEGAIIQKYLMDIRSNVNKIKNFYEWKLSNMEKQIKQKGEQLSKLVKQNTEKCNILLSLTKNGNQHLECQLKEKAHKVKTLPYRLEDYLDDCKKFSIILKHQEGQIHILKNEIKVLSMKTRIAPTDTTKCREEYEPFWNTPADDTENKTDKDLKSLEEESIVVDDDDSESENEKLDNETQKVVSNVIKDVLKRFSSPAFKSSTKNSHDKHNSSEMCLEEDLASNNFFCDSGIDILLEETIREVFDKKSDVLGIIDEMIYKLTLREQSGEDSIQIQELLHEIILNLSSLNTSDPVKALFKIFEDLIGTSVTSNYIVDLKLITYDIIKEILEVISDESNDLDDLSN